VIAPILEKLAKQQPLNPGELDELRRWGTQTEIANAQVSGFQNGKGVIYTHSIGAVVSNFRHAVDGLAFLRSDGSIVHNSSTVITWNAEGVGSSASLFNGCSFDLTRTKIYIPGGAVRLRMSGTLWIEASSTGKRELYANIMDDNGVFSAEVYYLIGQSGDANGQYIPFDFPVSFGEQEGAPYLSFSLYQNSTTTLGYTLWLMLSRAI